MPLWFVKATDYLFYYSHFLVLNFSSKKLILHRTLKIVRADDIWLEIEKHRGYNFVPYLDSPHLKESNVRFVDQFKKSLNFKSYVEEPDFTIEAYFHYDDYIEMLQVMNMLKCAFWRSKYILEVDKFQFFIIICFFIANLRE